MVATGALTADGVVRRVGGIPQKARTAKLAGTTLMLVPAEQAPLARAHAGRAVRVVGVSTLAEAITVVREGSG